MTWFNSSDSAYPRQRLAHLDATPPQSSLDTGFRDAKSLRRLRDAEQLQIPKYEDLAIARRQAIQSFEDRSS
jgi:hypothetical protein